ncbi:hypothetical protein [Desulfonema magnum]|nr:hypothetical protein [Desulfonema magnum]
MQKTASLYFCTPDLQISALRISGYAKNRFALFLHSGFTDLCKKPLRSIFALRIYRFPHSGFMVMQKTASLYFCTPDL